MYGWSINHYEQIMKRILVLLFTVHHHESKHNWAKTQSGDCRTSKLTETLSQRPKHRHVSGRDDEQHTQPWMPYQLDWSVNVKFCQNRSALNYQCLRFTDFPFRFSYSYMWDHDVFQSVNHYSPILSRNQNSRCGPRWSACCEGRGGTI